MDPSRTYVGLLQVEAGSHHEDVAQKLKFSEIQTSSDWCYEQTCFSFECSRSSSDGRPISRGNIIHIVPMPLRRIDRTWTGARCIMPLPPMSSSICNVTSAISSHPGWVGQCDQRGTIDIIRNCFSTIFISLWVMLHLNVPAAHEGFWTSFIRKTQWLVLGALAPETLLLASGGQWASAKRSVADMRSLGYDEWTLVHAFYADSGGFLLHPIDHSPFPVTAKQIHYLVKEKYMDIPRISKKEIFDKSKADRFTKTIACLQTSWFVTECVARAIQKLSISPLELSTCAIILCTVAVYFFWLHKPLDVSTSTNITLNCSMVSILVQAGAKAEKPFWNSPMDFVEPPNVYTVSNWPSLARHCEPYKRPFSRIPNDRNPQIYGISQRLAYSILVTVFSNISCAEWYFEFPTATEKLIWRTSCIVAGSSLLVHALMEAISHHRPPHDYLYIAGYIIKWPANLMFFVPAAAYFVARIALVAVALASLRALPRESYVELQWSTFIPHL